MSETKDPYSALRAAQAAQEAVQPGNELQQLSMPRIWKAALEETARRLFDDSEPDSQVES